MENSTEFFYEKLQSSTNPGAVLAAHYCSLYEVEITKAVIIMCNRLVKVFGKFTVFFAILDMYGSYEKLTDTPFPLLYTICKRRFESSHGGSLVSSRGSLDGFIKSIDKDIQHLKKKKLKIPSSEGL